MTRDEQEGDTQRWLHELLLRNPCTHRGAGHDRPTSRPVLSEQSVWALAAHSPARYQAFLWLAAATALRSAELGASRRRDIDLLRKTVRVERAYIEPTTGEPYFGPPKSNAGARTVPLPEVVVSILYDHLGRFAQPGPDGLLFLSEKGEPIVRHNRKCDEPAEKQTWTRRRTYTTCVMQV